MGILLTLICLVFAGGAALISLGYPSVFWLGICLITISILAIVSIGAWWLWLSNRKWKFRTSDDKTVWHRYFVNGAPVLRRSQNQKEDMFYEVDIGRERSIVAVRFDCGDTCEAPIKSRFWFFRKGGGHSFPEDSRHPYIEKEGDNPTELRLEQPIRAQRINMQIIKPDIVQPWRVEAVYVKVKILFGLREHTIGRFFLDAL